MFGAPRRAEHRPATPADAEFRPAIHVNRERRRGQVADAHLSTSRTRIRETPNRQRYSRSS
ncbi:hypothetical protein BCD49_07045 [Pseudofrankia sp. EUN1h]|nr:hypothetical protein BCD49_07045 [Pseudofrankia sp. EUN1h]